MRSISLNPIKGFRDLLPQGKAVQEYLFAKLDKLACLYGFEKYDGPLLEPVELYLNKSSEELVYKQTFQVKDRKGETLIMRPEMTPSLARIIAANAGAMTFPQKLYNIGLRYRYEAPQKGREREFYQADFDILGSDSVLADAETIALAANIFLSLGAKETDFKIFINYRPYVLEKLAAIGFQQEKMKAVFKVIDLKDKIAPDQFKKIVADIDSDEDKVRNLVNFLENSDWKSIIYFKELFDLLEKFGVDKYCQVDFNIVRGLDYYTGVVFEAKEQGGLARSLLGGGRYDNLVSTYDSQLKIPGIGFATSDVVLQEFAKNKNLLPELKTNKVKALIAVFDKQSTGNSLELLTRLREKNIAAEIFPDFNAKLEKQLKYANRKGIPYAVIVGPEESASGKIKLKNMATGEQKILSYEELLKELC